MKNSQKNYIKKVIKLLIPPVLLHIKAKILGRPIEWIGNYSTWEEAKSLSKGYEQSSILNKVKDALLKVQKGEAPFERDGILFDEIEYSWPLLSGLLWSTVLNNNELHVLDFGGSLGSTYFQNRKFLNHLRNLSWNIVEQENFVLCGKQNFENNQLKFHYSINDIENKEKLNTLLISSTLHYLEDPYSILKSLLSHDFEVVIIDRTFFKFDNQQQIVIQKTSKKIYEATYPCHILSEKYFLNFFREQQFQLIEKFIGIEGQVPEGQFLGFIFKKIRSIS